MDLHEFRDAVVARAHVAPDEADRMTEATLATLAERITAEEARHLAAQLPDALQPLLASGGGERFSEGEFVRRFMARSGEGPDRAGLRAAAVLAVLREAVTPGEWADVLAQLPADPVATLPGEPPDPVAVQTMADELARRPTGRSWHRTGGEEWVAVTDDEQKRGVVRAVGRSFEARVYRRPTGDTGPRIELAHGPQVFDRPETALDYADAQMGWGR